MTALSNTNYVDLISAGTTIVEEPFPLDYDIHDEHGILVARRRNGSFLQKPDGSDLLWDQGFNTCIQIGSLKFNTCNGKLYKLTLSDNYQFTIVTPSAEVEKKDLEITEAALIVSAEEKRIRDEQDRIREIERQKERQQREVERQQRQAERQQREVERQQREIERQQREIERHQRQVERQQLKVERQQLKVERQQREELHHDIKSTTSIYDDPTVQAQLDALRAQVGPG